MTANIAGMFFLVFKKILFNDYLQIDLRLAAISLRVMTMTGMLYYIYTLLLLMIIYRLLLRNENNDDNGHANICINIVRMNGAREWP